MDLKVVKAGLKDIAALRTLFLKERNFQFIYNKCHQYGWADSYIYFDGDHPIGYGASMDGRVKGIRDNIFEFYVRQPWQQYAGLLFQQHCLAINARYIECQSNDSLLSQMLFEHAQNVNAEAILFEDAAQTTLHVPGASIHKISAEIVQNDNDCQYLLKLDDEEAARGGFMLNYNMPYADLYYEVQEKYRQKGLGSYFTQELKKEAYLIGRVPAARCNVNNRISKATLMKAGFAVCGYVLFGEIRTS